MVLLVKKIDKEWGQLTQSPLLASVLGWNYCITHHFECVFGMTVDIIDFNRIEFKRIVFG